MSRILITGGNGFLGSALALHLLNQRHDVTILVRSSSSLNRLSHAINKFTIISVDNPQEISKALSVSNPDIVIHTACCYGRNSETLVEISDVNVHFGLHLLKAALDLNKRITFINTGTVLDKAVSDYSLSKTQFSEWGQRVATHSNGKITFLNILLQHMYGPGDDPSKFSSRVISQCMEPQAIVPLTSGEQRRDFIYIDDVVSAFDKIVQNNDKWSDFNNIDIGSGEAPLVSEFVTLVHKLTNSTAVLKFGAVPYRKGETMLYQADLTQMKSIGWAPKVSLIEGLRRTIAVDFDPNTQRDIN